MLEIALLFLLEVKSAHGVDLTRAAHVLRQSFVVLITACTCLYLALERIETSGLNLSKKGISIEGSACHYN